MSKSSVTRGQRWLAFLVILGIVTEFVAYKLHSSNTVMVGALIAIVAAISLITAVID